MRLMQFQIDDIIKTALLEDINYIDVTTDYLVDENSVSTAKYVSKDEGVLCGIDVAMRVFQLLDSNVKCEIFIHDGEKVKKGDIIARITGSTRALLKGERTALNIVQHMSGVATATNRCVELVKGTKASVADTRKTLPGLRVLQKYAVTVGGGKNHRYNLSDCAMLKDTHLDAYGSMTGAVNALREKMGHTVKIEVEVGNLEELKEALTLGVEIIMLDNMTNEDMEKAVEIIKIKISQQNKIRIICDYDIDGICSGYILLDSLEKLGANVDIVVPHRIEDGYGINKDLIKKAYDDGVDTILTCDNGIAAYEQVEYAKSLGMTIVITDHHEVPFEEKDGTKEYIVPNADAVVNPKQADCEYPFKEICGATVAYKLITAIINSMGREMSSTNYLLEYVAIATIGDVVELQNENRIIVKYGLDLLRKSKNIGLNALIDACKLNKNLIDSYHIGFVIGPCLNASGRLDTAQKAVALLREKNQDKAKDIATELVELNDERKNLTEEGTKKAIEQAENYKEDKVLVIYLKDCHESIAGIIAGRIREKYNKPCFVLTKTATEVKGSGRSIEEYDMYKELSRIKELFTKFGGHKLAAGLSLPLENVDILREKLNQLTTLTDDDLCSKVWIDMQLPIPYITKEFVNELEKLKPFGKGNEKPCFAEKNLKVKNLKILGKEGNVIKLSLRDENNYEIPGIIFSRTSEFMEFITNKFGNEEVKKALRGMDNNITIMAVFYPNINEYNGNTQLQLVINRFS